MLIRRAIILIVVLLLVAFALWVHRMARFKAGFTAPTGFIINAPCKLS